MSNIEELQREANKLRQEKKFADALPLYEKVWAATHNQYDGTGYLQCLRKQGDFVKAIPLSVELRGKFPGFDWARNESIWTLIIGKLKQLDVETHFDEIVATAYEIMELKPVDLALKMVVFKVLKSAKSVGKWDIVSEWADRLEPATLSTKPMTDDKGREGWSDQALWYNYKGKALIGLNKPDEILQLISEAISKFPKQKKILLRLKALAFYRLGKLPEAKECYKDLCSVRNPDWWLVQEYAKVLIDEGNKQQALKLMCQAALSKGNLDLKVTLFHEMGLLLKEMGTNDAARAHLTLSALVRYEQGWSTPDIIADSLRELKTAIGDDKAPKTIKEALALCRKEWEKSAGSSYEQQQPKRKPRRGLHGKVSSGSPDHKFCFIVDEKRESFFCFKSDLPEGIKDGAKVNFNALPTFDKKKSRESWRAVDVFLSD